MRQTVKLLIPFLILGSIVFSGCKKTTAKYSVPLEIWLPTDDAQELRNIASNFTKIDTHIGKLDVRKFTQESYQKELLEAMAAGTGPDIFVINNNWLANYIDKIEPAPAVVIGEQQFKTNFLDIVTQDFFWDGKAYGVPLSVDSLALYYNKDLFNAAGILNPPTTWEAFTEAVRKLTIIDEYGNIKQSGAALGTAYNINRSTDILEMIMLQKKTRMASRQSRMLELSSGKDTDGGLTSPGYGSISFYTDFAKVGSENYTWNQSMHYSLDAFGEGNLGMMFNYSWHVKTIRDKNSKINFDVVPVPQFSSIAPANVANYYSFVVAKSKGDPGLNSARVLEAWQLLKYLTFQQSQMTLINAQDGTQSVVAINPDPGLSYIEKTKKPAARRDLVEKQTTDPALAPFARGGIVAKGWYQKDSDSIEADLADMLDSINRGNETVEQAAQRAQSRINQKLK